MKRTGLFSILLTLAVIFTASTCQERKSAARSGGKTAETVVPSTSNPDPDAPSVYFTSSITPEGLVKIYEALGVPATGRVALDQACLDLVFNHADASGDEAKPLQERIKRQHGTHITEYAQEIGLGTKKYNIVNIDSNE